MKTLRPGMLSEDPVFSVEPLITGPQFSAAQLHDLVMVAHTTPHTALRDIVVMMLKLASQPPRLIVRSSPPTKK